MKLVTKLVTGEKLYKGTATFVWKDGRQFAFETMILAYTMTNALDLLREYVFDECPGVPEEKIELRIDFDNMLIN